MFGGDGLKRWATGFLPILTEAAGDVWCQLLVSFFCEDRNNCACIRRSIDVLSKFICFFQMTDLIDLRVPVRVAEAAGQEHASVVKANVVDYGKFVVRYRPKGGYGSSSAIQ